MAKEGEDLASTQGQSPSSYAALSCGLPSITPEASKCTQSAPGATQPSQLTPHLSSGRSDTQGAPSPPLKHISPHQPQHLLHFQAVSFAYIALRNRTSY